MAEKKRLRDKQIKVFLLDEEYETLKEKCSNLNISYSDYFRQLIAFGYIKPSSRKDSIEDHKKFLYEMNHIGGNINQIARKVNSQRVETKADYENLMREINQLYHAYSKAVKGEIETFNEELDNIYEALKTISNKNKRTDADITDAKKMLAEMKIKFNEFMKVEF